MSTVVCSITLGLLSLADVSAESVQERMGIPVEVLAQYIIIIIALLTIIITLLFLSRMLSAMTEMARRDRDPVAYDLEKKEKALKDSLEKNWWEKFLTRANDAKPLANERDVLLDHDYDGIHELDNNLPPWWLYGFYLSIAVAIGYFGYYHVMGNGLSSTEEYNQEMEIAKKQVALYMSQQADLVDENTVEVNADVSFLSDGKKLFMSKCIACHLESGGGSTASVGPNLTDEYWLHGGGIKNIFKTIKYGVPEKGMISWKTQMGPLDMHKLANYVYSLQGSNPPGAKDPEGELYVEEEPAE